MSLSAGESALFCMFASIICDADLSAMQFESFADITGIVVIDEADLHLHKHEATTAGRSQAKECTL